MPTTFASQLTKEQVDALVAFLMSAGKEASQRTRASRASSSS
jgi:cytochrome c1